MNNTWQNVLKFDPIPSIQKQPDPALEYFIDQDLLGKPVPAISNLWETRAAVALIQKQQPDGSWKYTGRPSGSLPGQNYSLLETYRKLRILVEVYGINQEHPALNKAAEYVFSCQTEEGDLRGILGNQYMPYYHGAIMELLIKSGYADDVRVRLGLDWLLSMQQEDGGWIVPTQLVPARDRTPEYWQSAPLPPDKTKPHAHLATGMVLRAFAAHADYHQRPEVMHAGEALKRRLLHADKYNDRKSRSYWLKFQYPFWWNSLVSSLDSLSRLGFSIQDADISRGMEWFPANQEEDGLWPTGYGSGRKAGENRRWVGLAICRLLKHYSAGEH